MEKTTLDYIFIKQKNNIFHEYIPIFTKNNQTITQNIGRIHVA